MTLEEVFTTVALLGGAAAWISVGKVTLSSRHPSIELSRRMTNYGGIAFGTAVAGLCFLYESSSSEAWRELELILRWLGAALAFVFLIAGVRRLRHDAAIERGERADDREDVLAVRRHSLKFAGVASRQNLVAGDGLYRGGWACTIAAILVGAVGLLLGEPDQTLDGSPLGILLLVLLTVFGVLLRVGRLLLVRYWYKHIDRLRGESGVEGG